MPDVRLAGVTRRYGDVVAVDDVDLEVGRGEFFTMLGPSGSGKTTTLRMIAGFDVPDEGRVEIGGEDVTDLPAYDRTVNTVFQDYALFPHMTVAENVEYGLRVAKVDKAERAKRAKEALEMIRLGDLGARKPAALSGGQRQRVALARAIVNEPRVLLLDEPLGALDLKLREQMQVELKTIQEEVGITFIYVTHDQEEALTMSNRVAVFNDGKIEQVGTPDEIYERPANSFVAGFVGTSNMIERDGQSFTVRPEKVRFVNGDAADGLHTERGTITDVSYAGPITRFHVELLKGGRLQVVRQNVDSSPGDDLARKGQETTVGWLPEHTVAVKAGNGSGPEPSPQSEKPIEREEKE
jgi:putative spermidine/putrescine transport system ATP-binding protein